MTKEELFKMMNEHPVMYVATNENGQPHVRAILMFKADADGIVFHTGVTKDLYRQLLADPRSEVCFACGKYQVRVEGKFELVEEMALKEEIVNHPSRKFLKPWREQQGDEAFFGFKEKEDQMTIDTTNMCWKSRACSRSEESKQA